MEDGRIAEGHEIHPRRIGRAAVEFGEVGQAAAADCCPGEGLAQGGRKVRWGVAVGPGAFRLMAGQVAARQGDDPVGGQSGGLACGGDLRQLFCILNDDFQCQVPPRRQHGKLCRIGRRIDPRGKGHVR